MTVTEGTAVPRRAADDSGVNDVDDSRPAPGTVVGAVAAAVIPVPFLAVYAVLFIVHGWLHPVVPPDITNTQHGELIAGIVALVILVIDVAALIWAMTGSRRWLFALAQAALLATAIDFTLDSSKGGRAVSVVVWAATLIALVLILLPASSGFYNSRLPWEGPRGARRVGRVRRVHRRARPLGSRDETQTLPRTLRTDQPVGRRPGGPGE